MQTHSVDNMNPKNLWADFVFPPINLTVIGYRKFNFDNESYQTKQQKLHDYINYINFKNSTLKSLIEISKQR